MTSYPDITPIVTERLVMRGFEPGDFPAYAAYYTDPARTGGVGGALPRHQVFERFCSMIGHWAMRGFGRYAVTL
ncbi:MAG: N-acetyltransferase, partial [Pseudomonadota bacterium]